MPVEASDKTTRSRYVRLTASPFVRVADILAFADKLREEDFPRDARVDDHHGQETAHLVGLSVRVTEERPTVRAYANPPVGAP
jgi:hypothetical protein